MVLKDDFTKSQKCPCPLILSSLSAKDLYQFLETKLELFITAAKWKPPKYSSVGDWLNQWWIIGQPLNFKLGGIFTHWENVHYRLRDKASNTQKDVHGLKQAWSVFHRDYPLEMFSLGQAAMLYGSPGWAAGDGGRCNTIWREWPQPRKDPLNAIAWITAPQQCHGEQNCTQSWEIIHLWFKATKFWSSYFMSSGWLTQPICFHFLDFYFIKKNF